MPIKNIWDENYDTVQQKNNTLLRCVGWNPLDRPSLHMYGNNCLTVIMSLETLPINNVSRGFVTRPAERGEWNGMEFSLGMYFSRRKEKVQYLIAKIGDHHKDPTLDNFYIEKDFKKFSAAESKQMCS